MKKLLSLSPNCIDGRDARFDSVIGKVIISSSCVKVKGLNPCCFISRDVRFHLKLGHDIGTNWDKSGILKKKKYIKNNRNLTVPDFFPFDANLAQFEPKSDIPVYNVARI